MLIGILREGSSGAQKGGRALKPWGLAQAEGRAQGLGFRAQGLGFRVVSLRAHGLGSAHSSAVPPWTHDRIGSFARLSVLES